MQIIIPLLIILLLVVVIAAWRRKPSHPSGGNTANTDGDLESLYSLLGDNSGQMKK